MVALNETAGAVEREVPELGVVIEEREEWGEPMEIEEIPAARGAFVDDAALVESEDLPAGTRHEQLIIQIRLMNPGATREMLVGFSDGALQAYVDHLRLAMTPRSAIRGRGRGVRASGVPGIVRHVVDGE